MFALRTLEALAPLVYTTAAIYDYGGFQGIAQSLSTNISEEEFAVLAVRILAILVNVADAKMCMADGTVVDCVLYAMLEHSATPLIAETGLEVLEVIATTQDAERHVQTLDTMLGNAATDHQGALKALAAACGLSRVKRLSATFEQAGTANRILKVIGLCLLSYQLVDASLLFSAAYENRY